MATETSSNTPTCTTNGALSNHKIKELAIDLPRSPGMRVNLHLTILAASIVLFLTTTNAESGTAAPSMGSFVYAMPDVSRNSKIIQAPCL